MNWLHILTVVSLAFNVLFILSICRAALRRMPDPPLLEPDDLKDDETERTLVE